MPTEEHGSTPPYSIVVSPSSALGQCLLVSIHYQSENHNKLPAMLTGMLRLQQESILIPRSNGILAELSLKCQECRRLRNETVIPGLSPGPASGLDSQSIGTSFLIDVIGPYETKNFRKTTKMYFLIGLDVFSSFIHAVPLYSKKLQDLMIFSRFFGKSRKS